LLANCAGGRYTINLSLDEVIPAGAGTGSITRKGVVAGFSPNGEEGFYEEQQAVR
jgi:hypothetical protein